MATFQPILEPISKALVYNLEQSSLLVISSNASCPNHNRNGCQLVYQHNSDEDAGIVYKTLTETSYIQQSKAMLIQSSFQDCTREGVLDALKKQVSLVSGEDGLFVLVYTGGACDKWDHGLGFDIKEPDNKSEDGCVDIVPDKSLKRYSLVLNGYQATKPETHLSGDLIGEIIQKAKSKQIQIILECPFADQIATDIQERLSDCKLMEVVVSQTLRKAPCYLPTLNCSTFTYFFTSIMSKTRFIGGMFPLRDMLTRVEKCCEALSSLDMVRDGEWLRKNAVIPKAAFMTIPDRADNELKKMENEGDHDNSGDQVDGGFRFQSLITKFYNWGGKRNQAKLCDKAKDWVSAVTKVYLPTLKDENFLQGKVLESVIGTMMFNVAIIQNGMRRGSITNPNLFIKAYMLVVAAVDFADPDNVELENNSLLVRASEYHIRALHETCAPNDKAKMLELIDRMKLDCS